MSEIDAKTTPILDTDSIEDEAPADADVAAADAAPATEEVVETPVEEAEEEVPADTGEVTAAEISYPPGLEIEAEVSESKMKANAPVFVPGAAPVKVEEEEKVEEVTEAVAEMDIAETPAEEQEEEEKEEEPKLEEVDHQLVLDFVAELTTRFADVKRADNSLQHKLRKQNILVKKQAGLCRSAATKYEHTEYSLQVCKDLDWEQKKQWADGWEDEHEDLAYEYRQMIKKGYRTIRFPEIDDVADAAAAAGGDWGGQGGGGSWDKGGDEWSQSGGGGGWESKKDTWGDSWSK